MSDVFFMPGKWNLGAVILIELFSGLFTYLVLLLFVPCPFSANGLFS